MSGKVVTIGAHRMGKTAAMLAAMDPGVAVELAHDEASHIPQQVADKFFTEMEIPRELSIDPKSPHFHPSCGRVGVRIDGVERNDLAYYNLDNKSYMTTRKESFLAESIEPYWRCPESRQMRRARQRWEASRRK